MAQGKGDVVGHFFASMFETGGSLLLGASGAGRKYVSVREGVVPTISTAAQPTHHTWFEWLLSATSVDRLTTDRVHPGFLPNPSCPSFGLQLDASSHWPVGFESCEAQAKLVSRPQVPDPQNLPGV